MAKYKLVDNGVLDTETGAYIPNAEGNRHWQEYQEWLAAGNTPDPADPEPAPPTAAERYDAALASNEVLSALLEAIDAGEMTPGRGKAAVKATLVARMGGN